jgi:hypothetical protein
MNLPVEIVNIILEYTGFHRYRNGKYIRKLNLCNEKYDCIKRKPMIHLSNEHYYQTVFHIIKNEKMYTHIIDTSIYNNKIHWYMNTSYVHLSNGWNWFRTINKIPSSEKTIHYVFGHNESQHLPNKK